MAKNAKQAIRIMFLNLCGGQWFDELMAYLKEQKSRIDVFCFQENLDTPAEGVMWSTGAPGLQRADLHRRLQELLAGEFYYPFMSSFSRVSTDKPVPLYIANTIFVRRERSLVHPRASGEYMVFRKRDSLQGEDVTTLARSLQWVELEFKGGGGLTVFNFHGLWNGKYGKKDFPMRLEQFKRVRDIIVLRHSGPIILGGDFNTFPESRGSRILEEAGFKNLVQQYSIPCTRSSNYARPHNGLHADNVFVRGIPIAQFEVPQHVAASDHLPLIVEVHIAPSTSR